MRTLLASVLLGSLPMAVFAVESKTPETVTVVDCGSLPRAEGPARSVRGVELGFAEVPHGTLERATLTEIDSKQTLEAPLSNGKALFEGVTPGVWSACQAGQVQASTISLTSRSSSTVVGALSLVGVAGGAALIGATNGGSSGGDTPATESGTAVVGRQPDSSSAQGGDRDALRPGRAPQFDECTTAMATAGRCRENESPDPLSPFS